ncbi:YuzB family protein [Paenibacillus herberti]|uniref:YuzB family protein n=1 Tax=Paenibacillus herberti TaxID=1619309 RepID=UPI0015955E8A|nr:YuzB family protein [Paenibacillus herberti]
MLKPVIEFCSGNMHHGTDRLMNALEQDDRYEVIEYGCLGNCGECYLSPFAMVDGEIISAESVEQLETALQEGIIRKAAQREALDKLIDDL